MAGKLSKCKVSALVFPLAGAPFLRVIISLRRELAN